MYNARETRGRDCQVEGNGNMHEIGIIIIIIIIDALN